MKIRASLAAGLISLSALASSAYVSARVFERIPHIEDEFAFLWQASIMAEGDISLESPHPATAFLVPFVVDHAGQRFAKYPPGWPAALSLGVGVGAPWLIQAILWGGVVWLTYRLGQRLSSAGVGLIAAVLTLGSPMALMQMGTLMSHGLSTFLTLAFLLTVLDLFPQDESHLAASPSSQRLKASVAGGSLGLLILTRPLTAIGVVLPMMILFLEHWRRGSAMKRSNTLIIGVVALVISGVLLIWQWALTGEPWRNLYTLWWPYDRVGFGPGIGPAEGGHSLYWAYVNTKFSLTAGIHDLFGWPWLSWLFLPFGLVGLRRVRAAWLTFSLFPSLVVVYSFYWVGSWLFGPRYYIESVPALAVLSAAGFVWLAGARPTPRLRSKLRRVVVSSFFLLLIVMNVLFYLPSRVGGMQGLFTIRKAPMTMLAQADLGRALVIIKADRWFQYAQYLLLTRPFVDTDLLVAWSNTPTMDALLTQSYQDRPIYVHDPARPGEFIALGDS